MRESWTLWCLKILMRLKIITLQMNFEDQTSLAYNHYTWQHWCHWIKKTILAVTCLWFCITDPGRMPCDRYNPVIDIITLNKSILAFSIALYLYIYIVNLSQLSPDLPPPTSYTLRMLPTRLSTNPWSGVSSKNNYGRLEDINLAPNFSSSPITCFWATTLSQEDHVCVCLYIRYVKNALRTSPLPFSLLFTHHTLGMMMVYIHTPQKWLRRLAATQYHSSHLLGLHSLERWTKINQQK